MPRTTMPAFNSACIALLTGTTLLFGAPRAEAAAQPAAGDRPTQSSPTLPAQMQPDPACPPDARSNTPSTRGQGDAPDLSDKLANSNGVICPPAGVDPEMHVPPPGGGDIKVIPPPGSPGGNQNVQPK